ncbi:NepR family anti-sigma factor [Croceicoccus sp. F390]|uniref:NepR family anti-sigma factor n=1 Tax=Croceicoccus esteveae TaxID=3075597 RepID=A0ABU2ZN61_9SPHN|nr:NepR family anti-sigma factor [Croceicoccus sp. F390]MDT0577019.1 NepR family anti-sigma factor [Croceicoccus sp. F390]
MNNDMQREPASVAFVPSDKSRRQSWLDAFLVLVDDCEMSVNGFDQLVFSTRGRMTGDMKTGAGKVGRTMKSSVAKQPAWATGLRHLYDSVVEEPLPNSFDDLLSKLDAQD